MDFSNNYLEEISRHDFRNVKTYELILESNRLKIIRNQAFYGAQIMKLVLKDNAHLKSIEDESFQLIEKLKILDLSGTAISRLPTKGLKEIEELYLSQTEYLYVFPSVFSFSKIRKAHLTYPHHCCAFQNPEIQDPAKYEEFRKDAKCSRTTSVYDLTTEIKDRMLNVETHTNPQLIYRKKRYIETVTTDFGLHNDISNNKKSSHGAGQFGGFNTQGGFHGFGSFEVETEKPDRVIPNIGGQKLIVHEGTTLSVNESHTYRILCGEVTIVYSEVNCTPIPDAFNPCEDVMGYEWLRIIVWFVLLAAIVGNIIVILVLLTTRAKMTVTKFLICNLAFADFLMGVYLLLLASIDMKTLGEYFNYAISWQNKGGCQAAGFLTVLSSELSIFTLTVITIERWYAISHAIHLTKRLKLRQAAVVMVAGWVYSCAMAVLPFLGISGYGTVSICLPMKIANKLDLAYVIILLLVHGLSFLAICLCYISMYCHVKGNDNSVRNGDATIAKRMALLVFTNFACWAPIAFFGLTASAGWPLIDITKSKILLVFFYPINSCANPFLYAIFTKHFRRDFFILLGKYGLCTKRANKHKGTMSKSTYSKTAHKTIGQTLSNDSNNLQTGGSFRSNSNKSLKSQTSNRSISFKSSPRSYRRHLDIQANNADAERHFLSHESCSPVNDVSAFRMESIELQSMTNK